MNQTAGPSFRAYAWKAFPPPTRDLVIECDLRMPICGGSSRDIHLARQPD